MTLRAATVAERLGFARDEALSLGKAVAVLTAQSKGRRLGIDPSNRRCRFSGRIALRRDAQTRYNSTMKTSFEEIAKAIWRQALVENEPVVTLGGERYPVTRSRAKKLRQVVFEFDGESFIGIEQNPKTKSRWAAMARAGKKVMQFIQDGRYIAVVADGKVMLYGKRGG